MQVIGGWSENGWKSCLLASHPFAPGEVFVLEATGGGGWGDPLERDPEKVLADVLDEYVSREAAREKYGVVITEAMVLDLEATRALRAQMQQARQLQ